MRFLKNTQLDPAPAGAGAPAGAAAGPPAEREERILTFGDVFGRDAGGLIVLLVLFGGMTLASSEFLTGEITAELLVHGVGIVPAILAGMAAGAAIGVFNGTLVAYGKLPPFIVTLGMLGIARGVVLVLTDASTVQPLPDSFANIANGDFLGLPNLLWMFVAVVIIASFVLRRTVFGRYVYAVGSNPESARLAGVPVTRVLVAVYAIAGLLAAVGGVLFTSRLNAGVPTAGTGYELNAIAACVIGGASLFGAKGGAFGAAAGALIVGTLNNGGNLLAVNAFYLQIIIGALILAAVAFDQWQSKRARSSG